MSDTDAELAAGTELAAGAEVAAGAVELPPREHGQGRSLRTALLDSRHRWRDLATLGADFAFETDAWGRFTFLYPETPLGWNAATLLGQPAALLLAGRGSDLSGPLHPTAAGRNRQVWLKAADGTPRLFSLASGPLEDAAGQIIGARGIGEDVTEAETAESRVAAGLRVAETIEHILWRMREEVLAPRMMRAALEALQAALGAEGCALVDRLGEAAPAGIAAPLGIAGPASIVGPAGEATPAGVAGPASEAGPPAVAGRGAVLHQVGTLPPAVLHAALALLAERERGQEHGRDPRGGRAADGRTVLVVPTETRFGEQVGLVLWRPPGGRSWDGDDRRLVGAAVAIVRMILEHESIQREMARQARTDPLTGLLNRRAFMDEVARRIERLERDRQPGTLMFADLDQFKALNDAAGHDAGDEALVLVAALLRATVRPADLIARLGGDEFALWLDGADELAAAERADHLCAETPAALAEAAGGTGIVLGMSIGMATRWPERGETLEHILTRADQAMYQVKRGGRGHWQVWRPEFDPDGKPSEGKPPESRPGGGGERA